MNVRIDEHPGFPHLEKLLAGGAPTPAAKDLLGFIGVSDPIGVTRNLQSLALHPTFPRNNSKFLLQLLFLFARYLRPGTRPE